MGILQLIFIQYSVWQQVCIFGGRQLLPYVLKNASLFPRFLRQDNAFSKIKFCLKNEDGSEMSPDI